MVKATVNWLLGGKVDPVPLPPSIVPLHRNENIDTILASMPLCDAQGVQRVWSSLVEFEAHKNRC
jgi:hypothetical protein